MATIPNNFIWATGRRKSSVARVRITDGKGKFTVNERQVDEFFRIPKDASLAQLPLRVAEMIKKLDVHAKVHGGGTTGQSGAIAHGLARAILKLKSWKAKHLHPQHQKSCPSADASAKPSC
jgi:small subunit ribosomal protein S9